MEDTKGVGKKNKPKRTERSIYTVLDGGMQGMWAQ